MSAEVVSKDVWWVGVRDEDLRVFDIIMKTEHGTTYNSYLIKGENKTALIDTVKAGFTHEFIDNIEEIVPLDEIDMLIVNHTEPDHSGAMHELLDRKPGLEIVCATAALPFVKNVLNREANITTVKNSTEIDLGGKKLIFKLTPYMHWPDTMMDFLVEDKILFSCDAFAAHIASESIWADETPVDFDAEMKYYYDSIMRPFAMYIRKNLKKLTDFDIRLIAPSHGPLIRRVVPAYLEKYEEWSSDKSIDRNLVTIVYVSSYGNTKKMADTIAARLEEKEYETIMINAAEFDREATRDILEASRAVLVGTPTFAADAVAPVWHVIELFSTVPMREKRAAVFGSYGWGGEGVKLVHGRLDGMKITTFEEIYKARLIPSEEDLSDIYEWTDKVAAFIEE